MPRYYCDYCDTYLTHDSPSVRKQHNAGYKHKANVRQYYQQFEEQQTQSLIDQRIKEHLGQAAYQVGAAYLAQRPRLPVLPTPVMPMPMPGGPQPPIQMMRPPVFPRPMPGTPGYGGMGGMMYPGPPGPPNGPPMGGSFVSPGSGPISPAGIPGFSPATYQSNAPGAGGNGFDARDGPSSPQDGGGQFYSHPQEASH